MHHKRHQPASRTSFPVPKSRRRRGGAPQNGPIFFQEETFPSLFPLRSPCPHFRWFVVVGILERKQTTTTTSELEIINQAATPSFLVRFFSSNQIIIMIFLRDLLLFTYIQLLLLCCCVSKTPKTGFELRQKNYFLLIQILICVYCAKSSFGGG